MRVRRTENIPTCHFRAGGNPFNMALDARFLGHDKKTVFIQNKNTLQFIKILPVCRFTQGKLHV